MTPRTKAWLEITRASNLPTVLGGALVTLTAVESMRWQFFVNAMSGAWSPLITLTGAIALFYMAGFILNDVFDRTIDREERPGRPIPSGRIAAQTAVKVAVVMVTAGLLLVADADQLLGTGDLPRGIPTGLAAAVLLVILIVLYNRSHLTSSWTVFLMGGCRAMVYVTCLLAAAESTSTLAVEWDRYTSLNGMVYWPFLPFIIGIFLYVAGFSRIARGEVADPGNERFCYQCGFPCPTDATTCSECGIGFEADRLERSSRPPMKRSLENLCLASTFLPSALLLLLGCYWFAENVYFARSITNDEFWTYFAPIMTNILASIVVALLTIGWLIVATMRYRSDRTRPTRSILMWIAAFPLIDANLAVHMQLPLWTSLACLGLFFVTVWGHRRIAGT